MNEDVINFVKTLGIGCRHPGDELFSSGDELTKVHKIFGIHNVDDEKFYHKSYSVTCHIPGCSISCSTLYEYDQHYNSCHRFSCGECNKYLPTAHLLHLHLLETHDAYFAALSQKKPVFQCYLEECKIVFKTPQERKEHCIASHQFPSNFRFDVAKSRNKKSSKAKKKNESLALEMMEVCQEEEGQNINVTEESNVSKKKSKNYIRGVNVRKPKLDLNAFVEDLKQSLPSS